MPDTWLLVHLNLEQIRRHLSREDRCDYSLDYVRAWLVEAGFRPADSGWLVREADLGQVQPSEVEAVQDYHGPFPP